MSYLTQIVSEQAFLNANPNVHVKSFIYDREKLETPSGTVKLLVDHYDDEDDSFWDRGQWWGGFEASIILQDYFTDLFNNLHEPGSSMDVSDFLATLDYNLDNEVMTEEDAEQLLALYLDGADRLHNNFKAHRWFKEHALQVSP